jgi:signal transduction histidine kinase
MRDPCGNSEPTPPESPPGRRGLLGADVDLLRSPVARRILGLFFVCALLPTLAVAVLSFTEVTGHLVAQSHGRLRNASKAAGMAIFERTLLLDEELGLVEELVRQGVLPAAEGLAIPGGLRAVALREPSGALVDLAGELGALPPLEPAAQAHLRAGGTALVGDFDASPPALYLVRPWRDDPSRQLVGRVASAYLLGMPEEQDLGPGPRLCVFESPGRVLSCALPPGALELDWPSAHARAGDVVWPVGEADYVGSYWTLFLTGRFATPAWRILVAEPKAEVLAPIASFRHRFPLVIGGVLCLVLLLSLSQIRRSLVPLAKLRRATRRIAERDFTTRVDVHSGDEFEELASSFNGMADRLNAQFDALGSVAANERLQRERAEAAAHSKALFLANMSHEIRTPMTAILGFADLLLDPEQQPEEREDCIRTIRRNGQHLLGVINDILDVSRIESGEMRAEQSTFDPWSVVLEVADLLEPQARAKGLALELGRAPELPARIHSDRRRLQQILINLVGNAIKFTERGSVRIGATVEREPAPARLRFEVSDTGVGIAPEAVARVFEPFWQEDASSTRDFGGTGLGLTIVRSLVELLGGSISLASEPGRGSRFHFTLGPDALELATPPGPPAGAQGGAARAAARGPAPAAKASGRVLLAEDGPDNQRLISHMLRRSGLEVEVVENGRLAWERALEALEAEPFDVILMDMQMPEMDGYEATQRLRADGYDRAIVALTAHALESDREKCLAAGCDDYATKPVSRARLIELLDPYLEKNGDG